MTVIETRVLTVGHSNHPPETFVSLLQQHDVTTLADVRSTPYSRFNPQFNRKSLDAALQTHGIAYRFMGQALGGRPEDRSCYEDGRVRYDRLARTSLYREGIDRVVEAAKDERIALMCAEKEPLDCHRTLWSAAASPRAASPSPTSWPTARSSPTTTPWTAAGLREAAQGRPAALEGGADRAGAGPEGGPHRLQGQDTARASMTDWAIMVQPPIRLRGLRQAPILLARAGVAQW